MSAQGTPDQQTAWDLLRAKARKFNEPTAAELDLPEDNRALRALEYSLQAPRAAQQAYWRAIENSRDPAAARSSGKHSRRRKGESQP